MFSQIQSCKDQDPQQTNYLLIFILRRVCIGISSIALLISMFTILRKKQYQLNTIKFFFWAQVFYLISLLSVTPHNQSFNLNQTEFDTTCYDKFGPFMDRLIAQGQSYKCAIQGFINLTCYSISYWIAVCLTIYISFLLRDQQQSFYTQKYKFIISIISLIVLWFLVPFVLTFIQGMPFSFGPTGYRLGSQPYNYLLYSGIVPRKDWGLYLVQFWMLFPPFLMFMYHLYTIWENRRYYNRLRQLDDQISQEKTFLIKSGNLSLWIFGVQITNVIKLILGFIVNENSGLVYLVFILNSAFDLIALVFLIRYRIKYYQQGNKIQQAILLAQNTILTE